MVKADGGGAPAVLRRPAKAEADEQHPRLLKKGDWIIGTEAHYYSHRGTVAGEVIEELREESRRMVQVKLSGTTIELLLQWAGQADGPSRWHLCPPGCQMELEGDGLIHVTESHAATRGEVEAVGWATNLRPAVPAGLEDENAALRLRLKKWEARTGVGEEALRERSEKRGDRKKRKKSRDRSEGRRKSKERKRRGRSVSSSPGRQKRKEVPRGARDRSPGEEKSGVPPVPGAKTPRRSSSSSSNNTEAGVVSQKMMFRGTALALSGSTRRRIHRKARRFMKRKKSSSSGTESSEESQDLGFRGSQSPLFGDELKIRGVSERFPGLLAGEALRDISRMVSADMGDPTSSNRGWAPQTIRYFRQVLSRRISGAMARELLTHCSVIDSLLEGNIPRALDISLQRIKGLELQAGGTAFQVSQRLEVIPSEASLLPSRQEVAIINRERNQEVRAFGGTQYQSQATGGKGKAEAREDRQNYKGKNTKGKGKSKAEGKKTEDSKKGSGGPAV